jgi:hypothetical protein
VSGVFIALIGFAGVLASGLIGFYVARLTNSGQIDTSTADRLWDEAGKMRTELRDQVLAQATDNLALRTRLAQADLEAEEFRKRLRAAEREIETLRRQVGRVEDAQRASDARTPGDPGDPGHS